jgi:hypothetical protein
MADIDQTEQPQLDLGAPPEMADVPPEMGGMPPAEGEVPFDLDSLLGEIDGQFAGGVPQGVPEQQFQQQANPDDVARSLRAAREAMARLDEEETMDSTVKRINDVEGELARIKEERNSLRAEAVRESINNTINTTITDEMSRLEIDPTTGPGKAFSRLLANSAMVAVAKEQTRTGNTQVDLRSVQQTVGKYAQLLERIAQEVASRSVSKQRRAASGSARAPITPSKPVGDMSEQDFDAAVFAALRG